MYLVHCKKNLRDSWIFLIKTSWDWEKSMQRREFYKIFGSIQRRDFSCLEERNVSLFWKVIFSWLWEVIFPYRHDPQNFREISWLATGKTLNLLSSSYLKVQTRETKPNRIFLT